MKTTITFNLPEDDYEYNLANSAGDMASFMWDFQQYLRSQWKYADTPDDIEAIYNKWFEMLGDNNINLDKLVR